ncbi:unnamed protein product [Schistocephalus solidus]|uniref:Endonuclease/exonuclease/phosphatase domain-containing protein n=1 Tax=Schistocephalus solidus TaxID=70667 RepID=A0A183SEE4_SCHSO|nr:unnamed protein product [Schistocephalus solidus]
MALPLSGIRARYGGTPRDGSGAPATCAVSYLRSSSLYRDIRLRPRIDKNIPGPSKPWTIHQHDLPHRPLIRYPRAAWVSPLTLAAWNVCSLLDNTRRNRSEWRTALVTRELVRYKVDIAAFSETRYYEKGQLEEVVPATLSSGVARHWCCVCYPE